MYPASFQYLAPKSLAEAIRMLHSHEEAKILAGGHSLIPMMKLRLAEPHVLIDLARLPDLRGIHEQTGNLVIGALTTHAEVAASALITERAPALSQAAAVVGDVQVRNRGTIGGSVAHADPNADLPVALLALGASVTLAGSSGTRQVPASEFFIDLFTTALAEDEVLTEVTVPAHGKGTNSAYRKMPHPASGYLVVSSAAVITRADDGTCRDARVALGGVSATPMRAGAVEKALVGQPLTAEVIAAAASHAAEGADPTDDPFASAEYKAHLATVFARRTIAAAAGIAS